VTLCIVWNSGDNIHFASDSRGTANGHAVDAVIKVLRIPYRIAEPATPGQTPAVLAEGELGMAAAGGTSIAMMTKEALGEVVRDMQGIPGHNTFGMDEIASLMFHGFKNMCERYSFMGARGDTSVIVAGFCAATERLRAFKMEHVWALGRPILSEVLSSPGTIEFLGSGITTAQNALTNKQHSVRNVVGALRIVIDDPTVPGVGGNVQYGSFRGANFAVCGVAVLTDGEVHYWRGPLDLNGPEFVQPGSLVTNFLYLDMI